MVPPTPIFKEVSKSRVKCSLCGRKIICMKYYNNILLPLEETYKVRRTEDDWICICCSSDFNLIQSNYAEQVSEGSC